MKREFGGYEDKRILFGELTEDIMPVGATLTDGSKLDPDIKPLHCKGEGYLSYIGSDNKEIAGSRNYIMPGDVAAIKQAGAIHNSDSLRGCGEIRRSFTASCPVAPTKPIFDMNAFTNAVPDTADAIPALPGMTPVVRSKPNQENIKELEKRMVCVKLSNRFSKGADMSTPSAVSSANEQERGVGL